MELQERDRDLTPEEQDNLKRSTKKIKTQGESTTVDPAQGVEHEESSPKPMEESPEGKEKKEEVIPHLDSENGESKIKSVKRALWVPDPAVNQSYKDKLVGINGRDKDLFVEEDADTGKPVKPTSVIGDSGKVEVRDEAFGPWMTVQLNRTKNLSTQGGKTPIKSNESNPKAPTKHPMAIPKGRADKDAQMEEQLRAMRMFEKQNREVASSLVDLGATQVYSNFL
ncbi:uncharacterized protein G2W53_009555 [Senna tora]|uniref:Uncharacterized protein n=2 Tax=Senna tora TaxID=362788 RepID=A0A834WYA3_9FABA|nr:uncharacterized protein G2W53_009555 [Senna tora]